MKKKIAVALCLICAVICGVIVSGVTSKASSANIAITADSATVKKEQEFSVKVTVSSDAAMQNIDTMLNYDAEVLEYVQSDSSAVAGASGMIHIMEEFLDPVQSVTYTLTFKALELGNSALSVSETYISEAETFNIVPVSSDSVSVEVITNKQESQETRLSELLIAPGSLNEEFNPDVYEYTAEAAYADETVAISAIPMDENAVVTMEKSDTLGFGENTVIITVTAPSGNVGTYTLTIIRSDVPEETGETDMMESETLESETAEGAASESTAPESTMPESAAPESTEQGSTAAEGTQQESMAPESVVPDSNAPQDTMPESGIAPQNAMPESGIAPQNVMPESAAPASETMTGATNEP